MVCFWESFLSVLPAWMRQEVNSLGRDRLRELHLRISQPPELILNDQTLWLRSMVTREDLNFCINTASRYSPWCAATMEEGFLTIEGGHRMGICGHGILKNGQYSGIREPGNLCIRIARDFPGIGTQAASLKGSILILGAPGWGKTTLLRDLIRQRSRLETVAVADERGELFPDGFDMGLQTDVLSFCPKARAVIQLLKTMSPQTIAMDEITEEADALALSKAAFCGVSLLATAHCDSLESFGNRPIYQSLLQNHIFQYVLILRKDQTYQVERMAL